MAKIPNPWDDNDNNPWKDNDPSPQKPKIVSFSKNETPGGFDFKWQWGAGILLLIWLASGFYQVQPNEEGVVLRFGAYAYSTDAGLHYHLPYPIEKVEKVNLTQERSINLGVQTVDDANAFTESHMLTGDENIVDINLTIVWRIENAKDYLYQIIAKNLLLRVEC